MQPARLFSLIAIFAMVSALLSIAAFADERGTITGRVVDSRGKGVANVRVIATDSAGQDSDTRTDAKGEFVLELEPGRYQVQFEAEGYVTTALRESLSVEAGRRTKVKGKVELGETNKGSIVRGSVFRDDNRSFRNVKVVIERVPGDDGAPVRSFKEESRSDSMGIFAFRVPSGEARYRLTATVDGYEPASVLVDVFGGELVNAPPLKLSPSGKEKR